MAAMACRCAPALLQLRSEINARWPARDKSSDGCCGDADHAARKSDHNPLTSGPGRGYACAEDIDEDIVAGMGDRPLWAVGITLLADPRTKYEIYEARLLYPDGTNRPYTGINDHRHHLHISIHSWAVFDTSPWLDAIPPADLWEDDDMLSPEALKQIAAVFDSQGASGAAAFAEQAATDAARARDYARQARRLATYALERDGVPKATVDRLVDLKQKAPSGR